MIKYIKKTYYRYDSNVYLVYDDQTKNCLIIDLGADFLKIFDFCNANGLNIVGVILTHGHYDHICGFTECFKKGIKVFCGQEELELIKDSNQNLASLFGYPNFGFEVSGLLGEGLYQIGGISFEVIKTSGHTKGSICIKIGNLLFSGDTLFNGAFGRVDFPTGSLDELKNSIKNILFKLDDDTVVLPGHGESTTIKEERKSNPINGY